MDDGLIVRDQITGSRRFDNYFWSFTLFLGGLGFLLSGISSYVKYDLIPFAHPSELTFIPQGILMLFYGTLAGCISLAIGLTVFWDIGGGYNEYNKVENLVRIVRKGFPGKNRNIFLVYPIRDIRAIKIEIKDGLNQKRNIYLCTNDNRSIPLNPVEQPMALSDLEKKATNLAKFLDVELEGI
jgi:hypothetical protein